MDVNRYASVDSYFQLPKAQLQRKPTNHFRKRKLRPMASQKRTDPYVDYLVK